MYGSFFKSFFFLTCNWVLENSVCVDILGCLSVAASACVGEGGTGGYRMGRGLSSRSRNYHCL